MSKTYRDWSPNQVYLFPPSPQDWLPEGDLVYFLLDTVAALGLSPIFDHYERELRGQPPFHPRMMVALLLYCYATGTRSSRKIMRRCRTDGHWRRRDRQRHLVLLELGGRMRDGAGIVVRRRVRAGAARGATSGSAPPDSPRALTRRAAAGAQPGGGWAARSFVSVTGATS